jgi:hypothetical protein
MMRCLALLILSLTGCASSLTPCAGPSCETDHECLANRCMPAGSDPVPPDSTRIVLTPLSCATDRPGEAPGAVVLGSERKPNSELLLRFGDDWKRSADVAAAFLLLAPSEDAPPNPADVPLQIWAVDGPWTPDAPIRESEVGLVLPRASGLARSGPASTIRIDVTELARAFARRKHDDGLAVLATSARGAGVAVSTGASGGAAPRLEIYLRSGGSVAGAW